jgi:hypothetical protein
LPRCVNTADQKLDTATAVELSYDLFILHHVLSLALPVVAASAITVPLDSCGLQSGKAAVLRRPCLHPVQNASRPAGARGVPGPARTVLTR